MVNCKLSHLQINLQFIIYNLQLNNSVPQSLRLCGCDRTTLLFRTADSVRKTPQQSRRLCGTNLKGLKIPLRFN